MVKRLLVAAFVAISPLLAIAQNIVTGHVADGRTGESLIGASVIVKSDKGKGVVTDVDGNFSLQTKVETPLTLRVEYVGYRALDVDVYDFEEPVEITLVDNASRLNEVVVVGYGAQKRLELTSSISSVGDDLPQGEGISIQPSGRTKSQQDNFARLLNVLIIAISLVYIIMCVQFESFLHPFTVMFSLPLMTPGTFLMLYLLDCRLDVMAYMGIILLVGIVVNNGIILVDFINQNRLRGMDKVAAAIDAGPRRLRAILITSLSTMIGAIPAALKLSEGSESRQPMSAALFGGLFTSTLLTLLVIPVMYIVLDNIKEFFGRKLFQKALP